MTPTDDLLFMYSDGRRAYRTVPTHHSFYSLREYPDVYPHDSWTFPDSIFATSVPLRLTDIDYTRDVPSSIRGVEITFRRCFVLFPADMHGPLESAWETVRAWPTDEHPDSWARQHDGARLMHVFVQSGEAADRFAARFP